MSQSVTQNGKSVKVPVLKGLVNFASGYRKDRQVFDAGNLRKGDLLVRERGADRTLVRVTADGVKGEGTFQGQYVTPQGKAVKELTRSTFDLGKPTFRARASH